MRLCVPWARSNSNRHPVRIAEARASMSVSRRNSCGLWSPKTREASLSAGRQNGVAGTELP